MTDPIIDNKEFGIEHNDAEGNTRHTANVIKESLEQICDNVTMLENFEQLTMCLPKITDDVILSTRYGLASPNSKALIPAFCEMNHIRFIGADSYTHMICNDKYLSKEYLKEFGLSTAPAVIIRNATDLQQMSLVSYLKFPVVIKPNYGGGSNGISGDSLQYTLDGAQAYIKKLQNYQKQPILVEEYIPGYEVEVILFGNRDRMLLQEEVQILIHNKAYFERELFDLDSKKKNENSSTMVSSSLIPEDEKNRMVRLFQSFSKVEFMRIDCRIYNGHAYILELSPDCYLGNDGGVFLAFRNRGFTFTEMFSLMIKNALEPEKLPNL